MRFKVRNNVLAILRAEQSETSAQRRVLEPGMELGECPVSADGKWLKVSLSNRDEDKGFVLESLCEKSKGERPTVERRGVVQKCVLAELAFNESETIKPWFVLADFLIARSIIETGVTNPGPTIPDSDGTGPLQISTKEWTDFIQKAGALANGFDDADRDDPIRQIDAAAFRMHSDLKALSALRTPPGSTDPFEPQLLDVLFAYLTDSPAAALAIRDAHATGANHKQPLTKFLRSAMTDAQVTALHKARGEKFFGTEAPKTEGIVESDKTKGQKSLNDVVTEIEGLLDRSLKQAFDDVKTFIPEAVPVVSVPESGGGGTTFTEKAPGIMRDLMRDFGFKDFQAAGILGNIGRETGGFTAFQERHPKAGRGGLGWMQWTADRRVAFERFCRDNGNLDPRSDKANYGYLKRELETEPEKKVVPLLKATTTLEKATEVFESEFERAGVVALNDRITWARRALNAFNGVGTSGTSAQTLQQQIDAGMITFDSPALKSELLRLNTGMKVTPKLQALVLKIVELAAPEKIRISSLVRSGTGSHHTEGRAVDIGNEEIAGMLLSKIATEEQVEALGIDELIFDGARLGQDRNKFNFDRGQRHAFDAATLNGHGNHIHFALKA